jgi:hypothetical protein
MAPARHRRAALRVAAILLAALSAALPIRAQETAPVRTILDLQPDRREETTLLPGGGHVRLVALNPAANAWFLLETSAAGTGKTYHLENPDSAEQQVHLAPGGAASLAITTRTGTEHCAPWQGEAAAAAASGIPFAPICGGRLYLRNPVKGSRTNLERITDFLRDHVWKGDEIVSLVKDTLFKDSFIETPQPAQGTMGAAAGPRPATVDPAYAGQGIAAVDLGLVLEGRPTGLRQGAWYGVGGLPGIYAAAIQPKALPRDLLRGPGAAPLDGIEASALDYLVAFDLSRFDLGFALGTDHPQVGWSPRVPPAARDDRLPGPDGIASAAPLVNVGMVSPALAGRVVATFIGGFKREHGAFKYGEFSQRNHGSHYGFIEQGVVFSTLQPGLATLLVLDDGTVSMKTWTLADAALLPRIRFARQNGVALVEPGADGRAGPGRLVAQWGPGNWSGSAAEQLRTLRGGACLQEDADRRFLIYGYFSTATPSAMARVFQAFGCRYAMLLDMNALEHTYLALYRREHGKLQVEHLIRGMEQLDRATADGALVPRFIGFPDNRDFFYLTIRGDVR